MAKISECLTFYMIFEQNRQENRTKTVSFVQEIADELNISKVYDIFNPNLK